MFPNRTLPAGRNGWPSVQSPDKQQVQQVTPRSERGYFFQAGTPRSSRLGFISSVICVPFYLLLLESVSFPPGFTKTPSDGVIEEVKAYPHTTHLPTSLEQVSEKDKSSPVILALVRRLSLVLAPSPYPDYELCCAALEGLCAPHSIPSHPASSCVSMNSLRVPSACLQK